METTPHPITRYRMEKGLTLEAFGSLVGVNKAAVFKWENGAGPSPQKALEIERVTGGELRKESIRPDIYPSPTEAAA
jgi:DNA-binding transcriptional regulator YdaS (Cro superfamily)